MIELSEFKDVAATDAGLCVVTTSRPDATMQASVVNAGVLAHPLTGAPVVGLVAGGGGRKLANLRTRPQVTVVARAGWRWAAVEGTAQIIGPDDPMPGIDAEQLRVLLQDVFVAAGGSHDDWDTYDRVMAEERRAAVLVTPQRAYSNG